MLSGLYILPVPSKSTANFETNEIVLTTDCQIWVQVQVHSVGEAGGC